MVAIWQELLSLNWGDGLDEDLKVATTGTLLLTQDLHQDNDDEEEEKEFFASCCQFLANVCNLFYMFYWSLR